jgi:hypothetical protein
VRGTIYLTLNLSQVIKHLPCILLLNRL